MTNYLPPEIQDFHDQKAVFKKWTDYKDWVETAVPSYMKNRYTQLSWIDLHILTCDYILYNLAEKENLYLVKKPKSKIVCKILEKIFGWWRNIDDEG